jgi:hypothetical protein
MAPQAIEIAQNGLGRRRLAGAGAGKENRSGRIPYHFFPRGAAGSGVRIDCSTCLSISGAATSEAVIYKPMKDKEPQRQNRDK